MACMSGCEHPRISAVVAAYNCAPYLERAVESLLATNYPNLEIVIVDDGSSDTTWDIASRLHGKHYRNVFLHCHQDHCNRGVSASRNLGVERSSGDLLCFLDADDYVYRHRFDFATSILRNRPDVDGVYELAHIVFADDEAREVWGGDTQYFGFANRLNGDDLLKALLCGLCWHTSAVVVRRSLLERTGGFDPKLRIAEDCHLWMRMACIGNLVAGDLSEPVSVYWRRNDSTYQPTPYMRIQMIQAMKSFRTWMRARRPDDARLPSVARWIEDYIIEGIIAARTSSHPRLAWTLALHSLPLFPHIAFRRQFVGNVVRMALGR